MRLAAAGARLLACPPACAPARLPACPPGSPAGCMGNLAGSMRPPAHLALLKQPALLPACLPACSPRVPAEEELQAVIESLRREYELVGDRLEQEQNLVLQLR